MPTSFPQQHSETLVFIGAGATAALKMPSTNDQSKIFRALINAEKTDDAKPELGEWFSEPDLSKIICFLNLLEGTEDSIFKVSDSDIQNARKVYESHDENLLSKRILELRSEYAWDAAKRVLRICPHNESEDNLVCDVYSIIDKKILSGQSLRVSEELILPPARLQAARNFLLLFVNMMFASAWHKITDGEKSDEFNQYKKFINSFDRLMQKETHSFYSRHFPVHQREFYLFTTSFVSFNFEMVFPWILSNSHYEMNHHPSYIESHPVKLWLDYGVEHRGRKLSSDKQIEPTLEFTESVASRENEDDYIGTPLNRAGKFYFAHGSSAWRECPVCGRMTFFNGNNNWKYKSKSLIPQFPIPLFETEKNFVLTSKEKEWRKQLLYDSLECMHCGAQTRALDAPMIMQTMYKTTPTSFLEEIQRNVKVALEKARHIVLLGYRLPPDDTIWYQTFAEAVRARLDTDMKAFCSVVVGHRGEAHWLYKEELASYVKLHCKDDDADSWGIAAIQNAWAIFGKENVRAFTGGIPQVFSSCTEADVKSLLYPTDFVDWCGTRVE